MLIICEQMERAYNSEYFIYFEIHNFSPEYLANNEDKYDSPYAVVGYSENDECSYIFGSYSTKDIANEAFISLLEMLSSDTCNIANVPTEENLLKRKS